MMRNVSIPAGTRRWPIIVIGILILLFIGFTVMSGFYVDLLWFREVKLSSVFWSVLRTKAVLGIIFGLLFFALLYVNLLIVRWLTPTTRILTPEQEAVDRVRQSLEPYLRWLIPLGGRRAGAGRRPRRLAPMGSVPAVAERLRPVVRFHGTDLQPRSRVLRLLAPVAPVRAGMAVLLARRRHLDRGHRALRLGRHPAAGARVRGQGGSGGPRAPVRPARPHHADEGVGLLPRVGSTC